MATFSNNSKTSQGTFTKVTKDNVTWSNQSHGDIAGGGFDVQTFDNQFVGFGSGNTLLTVWTVNNKETG